MIRLRRKKGTAALLASLLAAAALLGGCSFGPREDGSQEGLKPSGTEAGLSGDGGLPGDGPVARAAVREIDGIPLRDKDVLYADDDDTSVVTMYLTVRQGNEAENTRHTWAEINTYSVYDYEDMGVDRYQVAGILQVGDEDGPVPGEVGYGTDVPNATVQIRGQTSSRSQQKNYKIELKKNKGTWRGQRTINLNKHQGDGLRFRNKMGYDLIKGIPQMVGLRTQFVHLYVKDETGDAPGKFEDYGLYTQVEQLNKTGMKAHGLDSNGHLYKINYFEFFRYEDAIRMADDPAYDLSQFERHLEVKGNNDHAKLIAMLDAVNDYSVSIDTILEEYFQEENLVYWMAFQILTGDVDTQNRNMYLYSPLNSNTWYFLDWDNDGMMKIREEETSGFTNRGSWESGISNYWGNVLFQRCLKSGRFREELDRAIQDLRGYLSRERLEGMVARYRTVTEKYAFSMPDVMNMPLTREQYDRVARELPAEVEENYRRYRESLEKPMPFYIGVPQRTEDGLQVTWDAAYDFDAETVTYTVEVARDYQFTDWVMRKEDQLLPEVEMELPAPGQYFVRVTAENESGQKQDAFDYYVTDEGKHYGIKCFYVDGDGTIREDVYEE